MTSKKYATLFLILLILLSVFTADSLAVGTIYFTAANDSLLPLSPQTMPAYFGGSLYIPYDVFRHVSVYNTRALEDGVVRLYKGSKNVEFHIKDGYTINQDGQLEAATAREENGTVYLPVEFVCRFFGLSYSVIELDETVTAGNEPAYVVRIKSQDAVYNDKTFVGTSRRTLIDNYNRFHDISETPQETTSAPPSPTANTPTPTPGTPVYDDTTVFLAFHTLTGSTLTELLNLLSENSIQACFYLTEHDILQNPGMIRSIANANHTLGIWLETSSFDEYKSAAQLLFEATKIKTVIAAAPPDSNLAKTTADDYGLIIRTPSLFADTPQQLDATNITNSLPTEPGDLFELNLNCSTLTTNTLSDIIKYLQIHKYNLARINETTALPNITDNGGGIG